jgi:hypothetical protein
MKEIAASAAALAGLIAFAYVSQQPNAARSKRAAITIDETEEHNGILENTIESFQNLTNEQAASIMSDLTGEDVSVKQYVKNKMKYGEVAKFHTTLNTAWNRRWQQGLRYLRNVQPVHGNCEDERFTKKSTCSDCANSPEDCFDYEQTTRADDYLADAGLTGDVSGQDVFSNNDGLGNTNAFYYVVPRAIPLNTADKNNHIKDYNNYLAGFYAMRANGHFPNNMYLSYVIWQNGAAAAPKNLKYSGSVPSQRMNRFWRNPGTLTNQPFLGKSIDVFADTIMGRLIHNSPDNTATGDIRNCFILWFHQDMPADIESFTAGGVGSAGTGGSEKNHETLSRCTVAHAFVLPEFTGFTPSDATEQVRKIHQSVQGHKNVAVSDDFSGRFVLNSYAEITSADFHNRVMKYFAMSKRRRTCQLHGNAWVPPSGDDIFSPTDASDYGSNPYAEGATEYFVATESPQEGYVPLDDNYYNADLEAGSAEGYDYADIDLLAAGGDVVDAAPAVDRCCGHSPDALAYASLGEKSCCFEKENDTYGLSPYLTVDGCLE